MNIKKGARTVHSRSCGIPYAWEHCCQVGYRIPNLLRQNAFFKGMKIWLAILILNSILNNNLVKTINLYCRYDFEIISLRKNEPLSWVRSRLHLLLSIACLLKLSRTGTSVCIQNQVCVALSPLNCSIPNLSSSFPAIH